jgi:hypothetical protein
MMLTNLATVARRTGYPVEEVTGWKERGHGGMLSVDGVTCHHTANGGARGDAPSLGVVRTGRPGLSGPLAHFVLGVSGTIYVVAAGLCYHAGVSRKVSYGNGHRIGIEAEAKGVPGTASDWPDLQMDSYARLCRALSEEYRFPVGQVLGHKETAFPPGRKSDPTFGMDAFRDKVFATRLNNPTLKEMLENPPAVEEIDMKWTDRVALTPTDAKVWTEWAKANGSKDVFEPGHLVTFSDMVRYPTMTRKVDLRLGQVIAAQSRLEAQQAEIIRLLGTIAPKE